MSIRMYVCMCMSHCTDIFTCNLLKLENGGSLLSSVSDNIPAIFHSCKFYYLLCI